jgi:hypothetical protein
VSSVILYGLALAMLRGALIHEIMAQQASRRRLEQELHRALTHMLAVPSQTVTAAQNPDSPASMPTGRPHESRPVTGASVRGTGRM